MFERTRSLLRLARLGFYLPTSVILSPKAICEEDLFGNRAIDVESNRGFAFLAAFYWLAHKAPETHGGIDQGRVYYWKTNRHLQRSVLPAIAPKHHVIHGPGQMNAWFACHNRKNNTPLSILQS